MLVAMIGVFLILGWFAVFPESNEKVIHTKIGDVDYDSYIKR